MSLDPSFITTSLYPIKTRLSFYKRSQQNFIISTFFYLRTHIAQKDTFQHMYFHFPNTQNIKSICLRFFTTLILKVNSIIPLI